MKIIGISGKKGSGKDTLYNSFLKSIQFSGSFPFIIDNICFADGLRDIILNLFIPSEYSLVSDDLKDQEVKNLLLPCGHTIRYLLQHIGTDVARGFWGDCWVNIYERKLKDFETFYL